MVTLKTQSSPAGWETGFGKILIQPISTPNPLYVKEVHPGRGEAW